MGSNFDINLWTRLPETHQMRAFHAKIYQRQAEDGILTCIVSTDDDLLHISISHERRIPSYLEVKEARELFGEDVKYMAMIFPPKEEFVNFHQRTLHLWELNEREMKKNA